MNANIYQRFHLAAERAGDRPMLVSGSHTLLRYSEMDSLTRRVARRLRAAGARPGDRIVVQVDKSAAAVVLYLAALHAGFIYVPLNAAYTREEVAYFLSDSQPAIFVCNPHRREEISETAIVSGVRKVLTLNTDLEGSMVSGDSEDSADDRCPDDRRSDLGSDDLAVEHCREDEIACILYTSGTTGRSKGAMLSHGNLTSNALALKEIWRWREEDVLLHALPIFHVHGLFVALHGALLCGATMLFHERFQPRSVVEDLRRATVFMGVPTLYTRLLAETGLTRETSSTMRLFTSGSAPLLRQTFAAFRERTGHTILERYGMTETGMIASNPYDGERLPETVGYPLPGVSVRIAGAGGEGTPPGTPGVLEVKGPNVFAGYWKRPERLAEDFRPDGYFITGDIATQTEDGRIRLVGRAKDIIISGGYNIYPKEIELLLDAIAGVGESAAIGAPHPDLGEAVVAVVTRTPGSTLLESDVIRALDGKLARFKQPRRVLFVEALPRNTMGKVQKACLRAEYDKLFTEILPSPQMGDRGNASSR